jgi:hypothetical protein
VWLTIFKCALVAFIAVGVAILLIAYVRRSPKVRFRAEPDPNLGSLSTIGVPPTPLPEWAHWADVDEDENENHELPPN